MRDCGAVQGEVERLGLACGEVAVVFSPMSTRSHPLSPFASPSSSSNLGDFRSFSVPRASSPTPAAGPLPLLPTLCRGAAREHCHHLPVSQAHACSLFLIQRHDFQELEALSKRSLHLLIFIPAESEGL